MRRTGPVNNDSGFTLIEILVVLVLVGLLAALAVFTMGGNSQQRELQNEVRELYLLMQTASEQAVLNNLEHGLLFEENGYQLDRKSTRLNSSHVRISYAVFCLK